MAGRAILRMLLGRYLGRDPASLVFVLGAHGKPRLRDDDGDGAADLQFNLSHADSMALYAIGRGAAVGVDVERVRDIPDWSGIAGDFFGPRERARLQRLTADRRRLAFLRAWTRREALLKASGDGLAGETAGRASARDQAFSVDSLVPAPGYLAALASGVPAPRVVLRTWSAALGADRVSTGGGALILS
jgi:4'-phosphopantetheinyl transferase